MNLYSTLQIGDYHINHCEDDLLIKKISSDKIICAVMDGWMFYRYGQPFCLNTYWKNFA
ncbi:hypothetical protein [Chryseobacterium sp. MYb7]|uniref:hypothetical protein n=1 Tax=Chryseobacterium sp. MYb7 TaxID=1827290 RepID=UPI0013FD8B51|nr:hypothetical protein [Chryseobacterium sp. MYb7]